MRSRTCSALDTIKAVADVHLPDVNVLNPELSGSNGPYQHQQTLVRNLSHWLVTYAALAEWTGEDHYRDTVARCANYLATSEARPGDATFINRLSGSRDRCNGLIGAAWVFQGMVAAAQVLNDVRLLELGREVYRLYPFDEEEGLWKTVEVDGRITGFDNTFNHQLWFAVTSYFLGDALDDDTIKQVTRTFFDRIGQNLTVLQSGLILHLSHRRIRDKYREMMSFRGRVQRLRGGLREGRIKISVPQWFDYSAAKERELIEKSVGYHAFNTLALALIRNHLNHEFWKTPAYIRSRDYLESREYRDAIRKETTYGFAYNAPGFEVPISLFRLCNMRHEEFVSAACQWLQDQLDRTFDSEAMRFCRNTDDPATLTARIYELTYLPFELLEKMTVELPRRH